MTKQKTPTPKTAAEVPVGDVFTRHETLMRMGHPNDLTPDHLDILIVTTLILCIVVGSNGGWMK